MERRTGDAPMDFEYENRSGQRDIYSRWPQGDPKKTGFANSSFIPATSEKRPVFGSASDPHPSFPYTPVKSSIQGYRDNPAAAVAFSDTENPSSPDNADNEDTPEPAPRETLAPLPPSVTQFRGASSSSSSSSGPHKVSAFRRISNSFTLPASWSRPGRDGRYAGSTSNGSNALMLRKAAAAHKRKRPRFDEVMQRRNEYYSDSDADESPYPRERSRDERSRAISHSNTISTTPPSTLPPQSLGAVPAFFTFLHSHPDLPQILSSYGQTLLTWFLVAVLVFLVWTCWTVVRADVDLAVQEAAAEIVREVSRCAEEFRRNGCGASSGPPPALTMACHEWHECLQQDPLAVGRARVGARTFSRILNGFFEGMSWKFLSFVALLLVLVAANARALVPPFVSRGGGAAPRPAAFAAPHQHVQAAWHPDTSFDTPYFAPPATPSAATRRRPDAPRHRHVYMGDEPGDGLIMGSPTRGSPRKLGYI